MNTLKNPKLPLLICYVMICLGITSCECTLKQSENIYTAEVGSGSLHKIAAAEYGTAIFPETDTLELIFPCIAVKPVLTTGLSSRIKGRSARIWFDGKKAKSIAPILSKSHGLTASFPGMNYILQIKSASMTKQVQVLAGDANNDGKINMLDVYPIARGIREFGGNPIPGFVSAINNPSGNTSYARPKTGHVWTWNAVPSTVDFVHADCNMDGRINEADLNFIKPLMTPMELPNMLTGGVSGTKLMANLSSHFPIEVYNNDAESRYEIRAWYDIVVDVPSGGGEILGVAFTRPVAEDPGVYQVLNIQASTQFSQIFGGEADMLGHQRFWDDLPIEMPEECPAYSGMSKPLDVAAFNIKHRYRANSGDCIISCGVTIDDMLRTAGTGQVGTIYQHLMNVVVFTRDASGKIRASTTSCEFDAIDLSKAETKTVTYKKGELPSDWLKGSKQRGSGGSKGPDFDGSI